MIATFRRRCGGAALVQRGAPCYRGVRALVRSLVSSPRRAAAIAGARAIDEALADHAEAARVFHELGSRYRETSALYYLATAYLEQGQRPRGADLVLRRARGAFGAWARRGRGADRRRAIRSREPPWPISPVQKAALADAERAEAMCALRSLPSMRPCASNGSRCGCEARMEGGGSHLQGGAGRSRRRTRPMTRASRYASSTRSSAHRQRGRRSRSVVWDEAVQLPLASRKVDLPPRSPARRILVLLASRRIEAPGVAVPVEEIIDAAWPGERIKRESALNRVYVALATLRKLGLRDALVAAAGERTPIRPWPCDEPRPTRRTRACP